MSARARSVQPSRRPLDHLGIGALRHGWQAERFLAHAFQFLGELQAFVVVRADRENSDDGGRVVDEQIAQQGEEGLGLVLRLREEQLLALVDRQDQSRRLWFGAGFQCGRSCLVGKRLQERLELCSAALDGRSQIGTRHRDPGHLKCAFERAKQTGLAGDGGPLRPDDRQWQEVLVVAREPRKQAGAQERRFAGA